MSCSYAAYTLIGCELHEERMFEEIKKTNRAHGCTGFRAYVDNIGELPNRCPDCGTKIIVTEKGCKVRGGEQMLEIWRESIDDTGTGMVIASDGENGNEWVGAFISGCTEDGSGGCTSFFSELNIEDLREMCQTNLEPLGLWDPDTFGIHTILYISC